MCAICARIAQLLRSLDLVRCQSNLFMGLQRVEISDTNLDRGEFIYFWIGDFIQPSCRLFPGTRIRFHGREIFSLDFGTREQPRNKTLRFSSPLKFMRGGFRYRQPHTLPTEKIGSNRRYVFVVSCTGNAWLRVRPVAHYRVNISYRIGIVRRLMRKGLDVPSSHLINARLNFLIGEVEKRCSEKLFLPWLFNCNDSKVDWIAREWTDKNFIFAFVEENFHVLHLRGRLNFVIDAVSKNHWNRGTMEKLFLPWLFNYKYNDSKIDWIAREWMDRNFIFRGRKFPCFTSSWKIKFWFRRIIVII